MTVPRKKWHIRNPTRRKITNRGFTPIRYHLKSENRHGWIIERVGRTMRVFIIGVGVRRLPPAEQRYVTEV